MTLLNHSIFVVSFCLGFQVVAVSNVASLFRQDCDEKCEVCYKYKPVVFINPCLHRLCAKCAPIAYYQNDIKCLVRSCGKSIVTYENSNDNGLCYSCKEEASSVVLFPCLHKIGNTCAEIQVLYNSQFICPQCHNEVADSAGKSIKTICLNYYYFRFLQNKLSKPNKCLTNILIKN
ncbi:uncharacterized protein LOC126909175 [Daktulosphaira vitifoliae]|uniref:uncharacterized protein LOC126909175 n=1 Tax=Daktulosphaira vitifoliae TaxID=58002 RepID=UPI0021A98BBD|nr:uncharacterized protein LOC126909175 [Daktulosphaira vitifoliae]